MTCSLDVPSLLQLAEESALSAGRQLISRRSEGQKIEQRLQRDVKLRADKIAEDLIVEQLAASQLPLFTEETGRIENQGSMTDSELCWIVDPLDGSMNYQMGIPLCCVSIGLVRGWDFILGVVYDFNRDELFSGVVGEGARLNGQPIQTSPTSNKSSSVLMTGFPVNRDFSDASLTRFITDVKQYRKLRLLGSAALSLCYVACGRADAYLEENIMFWDVAAGCALVQAAGGKVRVHHNGSVEKPVTAWADNGQTHNA